ncbi:MULTISPECIES: YnhF family membrane protein [unclassified Gilliamella]|nr:YnhF family membrane protein [Gilliamella sp. B3835]MCX8706793.1 YnhF family membrane protein [Gilliamella sp. B3783]MCX8708651.1 YnhF family membrane protein [Gilliamella sp. B3780]MCX8711061.1 YnhF family membrane protein [Gilliamella sp. B3468]MCX8713818.1 YnhF family membrane protein [Gilliamella sp. B3781]MCX8715603.1 YnhF family membrane protein [Gilliamella sp. B3784]MCX8718410.1 YnhF family membrane protein [Gilliamella sp. B3788]MCX8726605.1 YnhF family membrane protein [Gilliame
MCTNLKFALVTVVAILVVLAAFGTIVVMN